MTCDFTSFSRVFQSYQNDEHVIMKGFVQWKPIYGLPHVELEPVTTRSAG